MFVLAFLINDVFKLSKIFECFKGSDFDDSLQHLDIILLRSKLPVISALRCTEIVEHHETGGRKTHFPLDCHQRKVLQDISHTTQVVI